MKQFYKAESWNDRFCCWEPLKKLHDKIEDAIRAGSGKFRVIFYDGKQFNIVKEESK